jgi:glycosyltransferase involved in cell wall biosynthesis
MKPPQISVVIPAYNSAACLAECIESVLAQDFADWELLIADDASTDGTAAVIERYAALDSRIRWWRNANNLGQAGNFNAALQAARGEFIKPLHADDVLLAPAALRLMAAELQRQPAVTLVGCASPVIDAHSRQLEFRNHFGAPQTIAGRELILRCFEQPGNLIGEPSLVMFRRAQAGAGFNPRYRQIVDWEFWLHLLEQGDFRFIAEPLAAWRQHPEQETEVNRRSGGSGNEELWLLQEWFARPWLRERATRQLCFTQIRHLRRRSGAAAAELIAELQQRLGAGWYLAYWLKRRWQRLWRGRL